MIETILSSKSKTVRIGPEHSFVIIGERINPTGRKRFAAELAEDDFSRVEADAVAQIKAGAQILDVNVGIPLIDEPAVMAKAVQCVQAVVDAPLSIDLSVVAALKGGLAVYEGKALVNSVTAEEERLESVLPLVKQYGAAVIGIPNDESGISHDPDERFRMAQKIVKRAAEYGIDAQDVLIDPLVMPIGAVQRAGSNVFRIVRRCREELGVNTVCGASNVSFGLPGRTQINATFVAMIMAAGMPCAITNPLEENIHHAILAADMLLGHDENCTRWLEAHRGGEDREARRAARRARRKEKQS